MNITCRQCGKEFVFAKAEQEFFEHQGFTLPRRCKECRSGKESEPLHLVCSQCGTKLQKEASIYCTTCLENVQLEFAMKTERMQKAINEAHVKLKAIQTAKTELEESLCQKEQLVEELQLKVDGLSEDLGEVQQLYTALNLWFQPTMNGLEERMRKRLEDLEHGQNKINERMLQIAQRRHEMNENITLLEIVKRSLRGYKRQSTQPT
jgi:chromosome segregation ATPase